MCSPVVLEQFGGSLVPVRSAPDSTVKSFLIPLPVDYQRLRAPRLASSPIPRHPTRYRHTRKPRGCTANRSDHVEANGYHHPHKTPGGACHRRNTQWTLRCSQHSRGRLYQPATGRVRHLLSDHAYLNLNCGCRVVLQSTPPIPSRAQPRTLPGLSSSMCSKPSSGASGPMTCECSCFHSAYAPMV